MSATHEQDVRAGCPDRVKAGRVSLALPTAVETRVRWLLGRVCYLDSGRLSPSYNTILCNLFLAGARAVLAPTSDGSVLRF